jgi:hypothetical protein
MSANDGRRYWLPTFRLTCRPISSGRYHFDLSLAPRQLSLFGKASLRTTSYQVSLARVLSIGAHRPSLTRTPYTTPV